MKILLVAVNGSYSHTNLAIRCLREPLEKAGFEVVLLERNLRDRTAHILQDILAIKADVVGFSTYIWNCDVMYALASDLKHIAPGTKIVFGGPEVSYETERFDSFSFIDAIICGEGEKAMVDLCLAIENGQPYGRIINAVPYAEAMQDTGIHYRCEDYPAGSMLYYESSRGCPYCCAYCLSSATQGVRYKSLEQLEADLLEFEKLPDNIKIIKFVDRTFNFPVERANRIWSLLLEDRFTRNYHFEVCASLLNEESFRILEKFPKGKIQLEFGLQSTNPETLKAVSRHINPGETLRAVGRIKSFGNIHVHLDLIAGLPYESYERFSQSFNEAFPVCDMLQLGFLKLLPGTALRRDAEKYGIVYSDKVPYNVLCTKWLSFEEITKLSDIDELMERLCESGHFRETLQTVFAYTSDYFGFFEGLSKYVKLNDGRRLQKISQPDVFKLLYGYILQKYTEISQAALEGAIHSDFLACETRKSGLRL